MQAWRAVLDTEAINDGFTLSMGGWVACRLKALGCKIMLPIICSRGAYSQDSQVSIIVIVFMVRDAALLEPVQSVSISCVLSVLATIRRHSWS